MNMHKPFEEHPRNSPENVLEVVESKIEGKYGEAMPELLSEFIKLLGNETEEWGGVKAVKKCVEDFLSWKKKFPVLKDPTWKDFQTFLFCPFRSVIVIQVGEGPVTSKAVIQGDVVPKGNPEERKRPDRPSSSKTVNPDLQKDPKIKEEAANPSTNNAVIPAPIQKTLKVKIYMGTGWDVDFTKRDRGSSPHLFVNLMIHGGKIQKTKVQKNSWGEEFRFPLSSLENDELVVNVYENTIWKDKFAGTFRVRVSKLSPGIQVIPLLNEVGEQCSSARLLLRFMLF